MKKLSAVFVAVLAAMTLAFSTVAVASAEGEATWYDGNLTTITAANFTKWGPTEMPADYAEKVAFKKDGEKLLIHVESNYKCDNLQIGFASDIYGHTYNYYLTNSEDHLVRLGGTSGLRFRYHNQEFTQVKAGSLEMKETENGVAVDAEIPLTSFTNDSGSAFVKDFDELYIYLGQSEGEGLNCGTFHNYNTDWYNGCGIQFTLGDDGFYTPNLNYGSGYPEFKQYIDPADIPEPEKYTLTVNFEGVNREQIVVENIVSGTSVMLSDYATPLAGYDVEVKNSTGRVIRNLTVRADTTITVVYTPANSGTSSNTSNNPSGSSSSSAQKKGCKNAIGTFGVMGVIALAAGAICFKKKED